MAHVYIYINIREFCTHAYIFTYAHRQIYIYIYTYAHTPMYIVTTGYEMSHEERRYTNCVEKYNKNITSY